MVGLYHINAFKSRMQTCSDMSTVSVIILNIITEYFRLIIYLFVVISYMELLMLLSNCKPRLALVNTNMLIDIKTDKVFAVAVAS